MMGRFLYSFSLTVISSITSLVIFLSVFDRRKLLHLHNFKNRIYCHGVNYLLRTWTHGTVITLVTVIVCTVCATTRPRTGPWPTLHLVLFLRFFFFYLHSCTLWPTQETETPGAGCEFLRKYLLEFVIFSTL